MSMFKSRNLQSLNSEELSEASPLKWYIQQLWVVLSRTFYAGIGVEPKPHRVIRTLRDQRMRLSAIKSDVLHANMTRQFNRGDGGDDDA